MNRYQCAGKAAAGILLAAIGSVASADNAAQSVLMPEVVVTATKTEENIKDVPASVQVITRADMDRLGAYDVKSALKLADNINLTEAGMTGNEVMIRGMSTVHTLILIDGQRMAGEDANNTTNVYELDRINLSEVERIEILRGASSALYGSDALGGVINIITKHPSAAGGTVGVNTGTRETNNYYHYDLGQQGRWNASFDADFSRVRKYTWENTGNTALYGPRQNFHFETRYTVSQGRDIQFNAGYMKEKMRLSYADADTGKPTTSALGKYQNMYGERTDFGLAYHVRSASSDFMVRTYYNRLTKDSTTYNRLIPGAVPVQYTENWQVYDFDRAKYDTFVTEAKDSTRFSKAHQMTVGAEYRKLQYRGTRLADDGSDPQTVTVGDISKTQSQREQNFYSAYLQDEWTPGSRWVIIPAVRFDHSDQYGDSTTPKIGMTYKVNDHMRLKADYGKGYRAPTLSELYLDFYHSTYYVMGNPNLKPEKSKQYEFSAEGEWGKMSGSLTYFNNKVTDLISSKKEGTSIGGYSVYRYYNVNAARIKGIEASAGFRLNDRWALKGTWDHLSARDEDTGKRLELRAQNYETVQLSYDDHKDNGISGVLWEEMTSHFWDGTDNYSYYLTNLSVRKQWNSSFSVFAGLDNIFNHKEKAILIDGRVWRMGASWKF